MENQNLTSSARQSEADASRIGSFLEKWRGKDGKLVVGIDGPAGSGKTTVLELIAERIKYVLPVYVDDFIFPLDKLRAVETNGRLAELHWADYSLIKELIEDFRQKSSGVHITRLPDGDPREYDLSKEVLVVEGVFTLHSLGLDEQLDRRVYIQRPLTAEGNATLGKKSFAERLLGSAYPTYVNSDRPQDRADLVL